MPEKAALVGIQNLEQVLGDIGGFGRFQVLLTLLFGCLEIPLAFVAFSPIYTGRISKTWICNGTEVTREEACGCNMTLRAVSPHDSIVTEWNLICNASWVSDFLTTIQMTAMVLGYFAVGKLSDAYGRKPVLLVSALAMVLGNALSASAVDAYMYATARFFCGAGLSACVTLTIVFPLEFQTPKWRPLSGAASLFGEGVMLIPLLAYYFPNWRDLTWISTIPFAVIFVIYPFVPESPRWLLRNKNLEGSYAALRRIATVNGRQALSMEEVNTLMKIESCEVIPKASYGDVLRNPELRKTTIVLTGIVSIWSLCYYAVSYNIKNFPGNLNWNLVLLGLTDAVGTPASFIVSYRYNRRFSLAFFMVLSAACFVALMLVDLAIGIVKYPMVLMSLCLMGKLGISSIRGCIRTIGPESYPTSMRVTGCSISATASGLASIVAPQIAFLGSVWISAPYFIFAILMVLGAILTIFLTETRGKPLQNDLKTAQADDNDDHNHHHEEETNVQTA